MELTSPLKGGTYTEGVCQQNAQDKQEPKITEMMHNKERQSKDDELGGTST
jgi:hypothetical protein